MRIQPVILLLLSTSSGGLQKSSVTAEPEGAGFWSDEGGSMLRSLDWFKDIVEDVTEGDVAKKVGSTTKDAGNYADKTTKDVGSWTEDTAGNVGNFAEDTTGDFGEWIEHTANNFDPIPSHEEIEKSLQETLDTLKNDISSAASDSIRLGVTATLDAAEIAKEAIDSVTEEAERLAREAQRLAEIALAEIMALLSPNDKVDTVCFMEKIEEIGENTLGKDFGDIVNNVYGSINNFSTWFDTNPEHLFNLIRDDLLEFIYPIGSSVKELHDTFIECVPSLADDNRVRNLAGQGDTKNLRQLKKVTGERLMFSFSADNTVIGGYEFSIGFVGVFVPTALWQYTICSTVGLDVGADIGFEIGAYNFLNDHRDLAGKTTCFGVEMGFIFSGGYTKCKYADRYKNTWNGKDASWTFGIGLGMGASLSKQECTTFLLNDEPTETPTTVPIATTVPSDVPTNVPSTVPTNAVNSAIYEPVDFSAMMVASSGTGYGLDPQLALNDQVDSWNCHVVKKKNRWSTHWWWKVMIPAGKWINEVVVTNREDCCWGQLSGFDILIGNGFNSLLTCATDVQVGQGESVRIELSSECQQRKAKEKSDFLWIRGRIGSNVANICKVEGIQACGPNQCFKSRLCTPNCHKVCTPKVCTPKVCGPHPYYFWKQTCSGGSCTPKKCFKQCGPDVCVNNVCITKKCVGGGTNSKDCC